MSTMVVGIRSRSKSSAGKKSKTPGFRAKPSRRALHDLLIRREAEDRRLVGAVGTGDLRAFRRLQGRYQSSLRSLVRKHLGVRRDRRGAAGIWKAVWSVRRSLDPLLPFRPWLNTFARGWLKALRQNPRELPCPGASLLKAAWAEADSRRQERDLLYRVKARDHDAFDQLYREFTPLLHKVVYSTGPGMPEAQREEFVQETWLKLWRVVDRLIPELPFAPYVTSIARHLVIDAGAERGRHERYLNSRRGREASSGTPLEEILEMAKFHAVLQTIEERLDPRAILIVRLRLGGRTCREIDKRLGLGAGHGKVIFNRMARVVRGLWKE